MATTDGAFSRWLTQAQVAAEDLTVEQAAILQAAFHFRAQCGTDYYSTRLLGHVLLHSGSGIPVAQIARLLAILLHPEPPHLVALEEPELGLHPDVIPHIAELLVGASQRMQLVVTTHSRLLVDALTDRPSSVVVCSRENGESRFERLDEAALREWLQKDGVGRCPQGDGFQGARSGYCGLRETVRQGQGLLGAARQVEPAECRSGLPSRQAAYGSLEIHGVTLPFSIPPEPCIPPIISVP